MIILKEMEWGFAFSYGDNNYINFCNAPLTQIVGANGHGKSSIALILEEVLYNKNSKGIKKGDILNRNSTAKKYWITLKLLKDSSEYEIKTVRGATQNVSLFKDGNDISAHTATATYKLIEDLIGYDHKTFCQIIYQSSAGSLEFLTATDGNRKKFLIDLLNLDRYVKASEIFKAANKAVSDQYTAIKSKVSTIEAWLAKYATADLVEKELLTPEESPRTLVEEVAIAKAKLATIDSENKRIQGNNTYRQLLENTEVISTVQKPTGSAAPLKEAQIEAKTEMGAAEAFIQKMRKLGSVCITCGEPINSVKIEVIIAEKRQQYEEANIRYTKATKDLSTFEAEMQRWQKEESARRSYEEYHRLFDPTLPSELLDRNELTSLIAANEKLILSINASIKRVNDYNNTVEQHNAKVRLIIEQMESMQEELSTNSKELEKLSTKLNNLGILLKTFSPTGLIAYKIECLIKDLEDAINEYLVEVSDGRFLLTFTIAGSDKLNVVITDNGHDIDIAALSGGERARVNVSALLGIRKLLQSLSKNRINLLILDETIENLDPEGKDKLVEVLLNEEHLNTFVVSHGFTHPLLEKLQVVKQNNTSRIEA
ncbi:endonuclease subunit [uncultured Caudovirales phage]|uniref:Endonuclease subunit n=1 Tax=uncultured Caudovirales phage TaxID=2100421 RepID=A0A6J5LM91_9CAUD|nr:endonuclease subunit [uncultured Caudovirales phage]